MESSLLGLLCYSALVPSQPNFQTKKQNWRSLQAKKMPVHTNNTRLVSQLPFSSLKLLEGKDNGAYLFTPPTAPKAALRGIDFQQRSAEGSSEWANAKALLIVSLLILSCYLKAFAEMSGGRD